MFLVPPWFIHVYESVTDLFVMGLSRGRMKLVNSKPIEEKKPVKNKVPKNDLNAIGKVVKAFLVKPIGPDGEILKSVKPDTTAEYGKYLVTNVANCGGCHTQRNLAGEYTGEFLAGGNPMETPGKQTLTPPNISTDSSSRIFGWTLKNFTDRVRMGKIIPHSHMPWNSFKHMTDDELKAIYKFLKTVKPVKNKTQVG